MFNKNKKSLGEMSLEEKVDEILKFQISMRRWAVVKTVTNVILFFLFIILPIMAIVYVFDWARNSMGFDLNQFQEAVQSFQNVGESSQAVEDRANELLELLKR